MNVTKQIEEEEDNNNWHLNIIFKGLIIVTAQRMSSDEPNALSASPGKEPKMFHFCRIANGTMKPPIEIYIWNIYVLHEKGQFCVLQDHRQRITCWSFSSITWNQSNTWRKTKWDYSYESDRGLKLWNKLVVTKMMSSKDLIGLHSIRYDHLHLHIISPAKEMTLWGMFQFK